MNSLLFYPYMLAITLFVGKIATFSFLLAPILHKTLEKEQALKLVRAFFPRYYRFGIACAIVGLLLVPVLVRTMPDTVVKPWWAAIWAVILLAEVYSLKVIIPTVEANREGRDKGDPDATRRWESAHRFSVQLNVVNLCLGLVLLGLYLR